MDPRWLLALVLWVAVALGFSQVSRADQSEINRLAEAGKQAYNTANYSQALAKFQQGLELAKKSDNRPAVADFLGNLGLVFGNPEVLLKVEGIAVGDVIFHGSLKQPTDADYRPVFTLVDDSVSELKPIPYEHRNHAEIYQDN